MSAERSCKIVHTTSKSRPKTAEMKLKSELSPSSVHSTFRTPLKTEPQAPNLTEYTDMNSNVLKNKKSKIMLRKEVGCEDNQVEENERPSSRSKKKEKSLKPTKIIVDPKNVEGDDSKEVIEDDSIRSSMEGTPVILSREGSMIRIVDEETGEVFFRKRSKSRPKGYYDRREPIFIPRLSSTHLGIAGPHPSEQILRANSKDNVILSRSKSSNSLMGKDVGDILVWKDDKEAALMSKNPFEESDEENELSRPLPRGRSRTKVLNKRDSSPNQRGILKKNQNMDENYNEEVSRTKTVKKSSSRSPMPISIRDGLKIPEPPKSRVRSRSKSPSASPSSRGKLDYESQDTIPSAITKRNSKSSATAKHHHYSRTQMPMIFSCTTVKDVPNKILRNIFRYLEREDLQTCNRVCYLWKCLTDLKLRGPMVFQGKSTYGHYYSANKCTEFVNFLLELEQKFYRPVELRFNRMCESQARMLCYNENLGANFRQSVRHMEAISLINCSFKWKTLMTLLQSLSKKQFRILKDDKSVYYTNLGSCICGRYRQQFKKEVNRKEFKEFKDQLRTLRHLSISRKTVTNELPVYLSILAQGTKFLEEIEVTLGPHETSAGNDTEFRNLLNYFVKELRSLINKNKESLKILRFSWSDKNFTGYFATCLDVLEKLKLRQLHTLSLHFDKHAMKGKGAYVLQDLLEFHYSNHLRSFTLGRMTLTEKWKPTLQFLDEFLYTIPQGSAGLDFKVVLSDKKGFANMAPIHQLLQLELFQKFISDINFEIEDEDTRSIAQMFGREWHRSGLKQQYLKTKSITITFEPGQPMKSYDNFNDFSIDLLANIFPNLTQLRISDRLLEHNQIFTPVIGRHLKTSVSKAQLENKDILLIAKNLSNLRILRLWVNMSSVNDHGMTGIHPGDISILHEEDEHFSWTNFHHSVVPSFSHLPMLEELSLRGLGPSVTDISLKFGFQSLSRLRILELYGKLGVTRQGKQQLRRRFKNTDINENEIAPTIRIKYQLV